MQTRQIQFNHILTDHLGVLAQEGPTGKWTFGILVGSPPSRQFVGRWDSEIRASEILGTMGFRKTSHVLAREHLNLDQGALPVKKGMRPLSTRSS
jgi:hypothetical protein